MSRLFLLALGAVAVMTGAAFAIDEPAYRVAQKYSDFELRDYAPYLVAETTVEADFAGAGSEGFRLLFDYISGRNTTHTSITMTAPVMQSGQKIAMTAPVMQSGAPGAFVIAFVMPANFTLKTLPTPANSKVRLRQIEAQHVAVWRYSGFWSQSRYLTNLASLEAGLRREHLTASGAPVWARYDPPFMPWIFRRNEILIPVAAP